MHKGVEVKVTSSGRTDAGVHARGQVFHFDSWIDLPSERWVNALNGLLPQDISLQQVDKVDNPNFMLVIMLQGKHISISYLPGRSGTHLGVITHLIIRID